jgi:hypothetical protein
VITNKGKDIIAKYLIGNFVTTGLYIFSLLPNCGICSDNSNKIIRFISAIIYYGSYIAFYFFLLISAFVLPRNYPKLNIMS